VLGELWIVAAPDYYAEADGLPSDGTPTGNLAYAAICFVIAALAVYSVSAKATGSSTGDASEATGAGPAPYPNPAPSTS
jgi:hypothetical protein